MSNENIKELIENELSALVGKRIRQFRRAALMLGVDIGEDVEFKYTVGAKRGEVTTRSKYVLHIHAPWRLFKDCDICLSQSAMFTNMNGFRWCEDNEETIDSFPFARISRDINELFEIETINITKIEANEQGDLKLYMENDYCLEIFVDSIGDTESWRFFETIGDRSLVIFDDGD